MANKSKNVSFRFDIERFGFIKTKEGLEKNQQVLDFLVNKYWWEHKVAKPTHKDTPPIAEHFTKPEPKKGPEQVVSMYDAFYRRLEACKTVLEVGSVVKDAEKDSSLIWAEKRDLKAFAQECSKNMYTD